MKIYRLAIMQGIKLIKTYYKNGDVSHYECLRMHMDLKNTPFIFQELMNLVLGDLIGTH